MPSDRSSIEAVVQTYFDGLYEGDADKLAAQLWSLVLETASVAFVVFLASLALMRTLLRRWLDNLGRLRSFEDDVAAGRVTAEAALLANAPTEIKEAIRAVNRSAASLREHGIRRVWLWGRGVDTERFDPARRSPRLRHEVAPGGGLLVGYVGRLAPEKRVDLLWQVGGLPGVRLVIAGDGPAGPRGTRPRAGPGAGRRGPRGSASPRPP